MPNITLGDKQYVVTNVGQHNPRRASRLGDSGLAHPWVVTAAMLARWGIGWSKSRRSEEQGVGGMIDANADTRFAIGNYGVGVGTFQNDDTYNATSTIQDSGATSITIEGADIAEHKGALYALYALEASSPADMGFEIESYDGSSWTTASGTGFPAVTTLYRKTSNSSPADNGNWAGLVFDAPTTARHDIIAVLGEDAAASGGAIDQGRVYYSANTGTNWTLAGTAPGRPLGKGMWRDPFTAGFPVAPIISTDKNIYLIDPANNEVAPLLNDSVLREGGVGGYMIVGVDDSVYVADNNGDVLRISLGNEVGELRPPVNLGPNTRTANGGDGIIAAKQGPITAMATSATFVYVAFQGASKAHIMCYSYEFGSWHSFYERADTNRIYRMAFSSEDDGTERLHIAVDAGSTIDLIQFEEPNSSLKQLTAPTLATGSHIELAEEDFEDAGITTGVIYARVRADDLSASTAGEYLTSKYGIDGAAYTTTTQGNFLSGTKTLQYEANSRGISLNTLNTRIEWTRDAGVVTDTVTLVEFEVYARNKQNVLDGWTITVDLAETAAMFPGDHGANGNPEDVITNLKASRDSATLVPFIIGENGEVQVDMLNESLAITLAESGGGDGMQSGQRAGVATFTIEEVQ